MLLQDKGGLIILKLHYTIIYAVFTHRPKPSVNVSVNGRAWLVMSSQRSMQFHKAQEPSSSESAHEGGRCGGWGWAGDLFLSLNLAEGLKVGLNF